MVRYSLACRFLQCDYLECQLEASLIMRTALLPDSRSVWLILLTLQHQSWTELSSTDLLWGLYCNMLAGKPRTMFMPLVDVALLGVTLRCITCSDIAVKRRELPLS